MAQPRARRLQIVGERIARRSVRRAIWQWHAYRGLNRLRGNKVLATITFPDYIVQRTELRGRATRLVTPTFSSFSWSEQEEAAEPVLRELMAKRDDCAGITISTYQWSVGFIGGWGGSTGWCAKR